MYQYNFTLSLTSWSVWEREWQIFFLCLPWRFSGWDYAVRMGRTDRKLPQWAEYSSWFWLNALFMKELITRMETIKELGCLPHRHRDSNKWNTKIQVQPVSLCSFTWPPWILVITLPPRILSSGSFPHFCWLNTAYQRHSGEIGVKATAIACYFKNTKTFSSKDSFCKISI